MNYSEFYKIAEYLNGINRNTFSHSEVAENAHIYTCDFAWSKENHKVATSIRELYKLLVEDGTEECREWAYEIVRELKLVDMYYIDYVEEKAKVLMQYIQD